MNRLDGQGLTTDTYWWTSDLVLSSMFDMCKMTTQHVVWPCRYFLDDSLTSCGQRHPVTHFSTLFFWNLTNSGNPSHVHDLLTFLNLLGPRVLILLIAFIWTVRTHIRSQIDHICNIDRVRAWLPTFPPCFTWVVYISARLKKMSADHVRFLLIVSAVTRWIDWMVKV